MANLNRVFLIGRLTKDPELRHLPNGTPKAELRMASSRTYTTNGEKREDTCYVDIVAWSRQAEIVSQYLKKGSQIFVEGRLDYQEWTSQDGSKRSKHQVVADRVQFLDPRGAPNGQASGELDEASPPPSGGYAPRGGYQGRYSSYSRNAAPAGAVAAPAASETAQADSPPADGPPIADDDIPF